MEIVELLNWFVYVPGTTYLRHLVNIFVLRPLQLYESVAILLVSYLRRNMPLIGGACVILMTFYGILFRWILEISHGVVAKVFYSSNAKLNFHVFWKCVRDEYAYFNTRSVDWDFILKLFGDKMHKNTSEEDLWAALVDSLLMLDDQSFSLSRHGGRNAIHGVYEKKNLDVNDRFNETVSKVRHRYLIDGGGSTANHFVYGIFNAEISPGWRIGYISLSAMSGFVDLPRLESFMPQNNHNKMKKSRGYAFRVPELYDIEAMRWAWEALLQGMGKLDGLILDLRFNQGGGTLLSPLHAASFFLNTKLEVFSVDERVAGGASLHKFCKKKKFFLPNHRTIERFRGPLVILQSQFTSGTAEVLSMALQQRPDTFRIGTRSSGYISQLSEFRLPNGWHLKVPFQRCYNYKGELYEGKGVAVDKELEEFTTLNPSTSNASSPIPLPTFSSPPSSKRNTNGEGDGGGKKHKEEKKEKKEKENSENSDDDQGIKAALRHLMHFGGE